jgi:hypothetical protein
MASVGLSAGEETAVTVMKEADHVRPIGRSVDRRRPRGRSGRGYLNEAAMRATVLGHAEPSRSAFVGLPSEEAIRREGEKMPAAADL